MTLLDAILLVGSAAIGMGLFQLTYRSLFQGWIWIMVRGLPDVRSWEAIDVIVMFTDLAVFLIPVVGPWTVLLLVLRMRPPRLSWRRIWRQPGMAACLAVLFGWCWSGLALILAMDAGLVARKSRFHTPDQWAQRYLADEVFMYVGLAVASVWIVQVLSGQWRRSADWIDRMGRFVGILWIVIGLVWTVREYIEFV
jgi:hypothetical protein